MYLLICVIIYVFIYVLFYLFISILIYFPKHIYFCIHIYISVLNVNVAEECMFLVKCVLHCYFFYFPYDRFVWYICVMYLYDVYCLNLNAMYKFLCLCSYVGVSGSATQLCSDWSSLIKLTQLCRPPVWGRHLPHVLLTFCFLL